MAKRIRVTLEIGPKGKKVVAIVLSGNWLNRLLGYFVRVFEPRPASHVGRAGRFSTLNLEGSWSESLK